MKVVILSKMMHGLLLLYKKMMETHGIKKKSSRKILGQLSVKGQGKMVTILYKLS